MELSIQCCTKCLGSAPGKGGKDTRWAERESELGTPETPWVGLRCPRLDTTQTPHQFAIVCQPLQESRRWLLHAWIWRNNPSIGRRSGRLINLQSLALFCFAAKSSLCSFPLDSLGVPVWSPMLEILHKQNLCHSPDQILNRVST